MSRSIPTRPSSPALLPVLDSVARSLNQHQELRAKVVGHTDSTGAMAHNQTLSVNRAKSVTDYLARQGVPPPVGRGPRAERSDRRQCHRRGRAANRRVEIYLYAVAIGATAVRGRRRARRRLDSFDSQESTMSMFPPARIGAQIAVAALSGWQAVAERDAIEKRYRFANFNACSPSWRAPPCSRKSWTIILNGPMSTTGWMCC